jgi:threonine dehydrogenase-like Zn-dependent dehydrogenase
MRPGMQPWFPSSKGSSSRLSRNTGVIAFASLPVGASMLSLDSRSIHYNEIIVTGASDSTPRQVQKAVSILSRKDFPKERIAHPVLKLQDIQQAFRIMKEREGMRVVLKPWRNPTASPAHWCRGCATRG